MGEGALNVTCTTQTIPTDAALELLAHHRRREILRYLIENDSTAVSVDELVAELSGSDSRPGETDDGGRDRLRTVLCHAHLPKLADHDVIEYDRQSETVRYRSHPALEDMVRFISTLE